MRIAEDENKRVLVENGKLYQREEKQTTRIFGSDSNGYLQATFKGKQQGIHRHVYEAFKGPIPEGYHVNHMNWSRNDNRVENLEATTVAQNNANRQRGLNNQSGIIGVSFHNKWGKWQASNQSANLNNGKNKRIGSFDTKEEAGLARDLYVIENHLDHHTLNFPSARLKPLDGITPQQNYVNRQKRENNTSNIIGVSLHPRGKWEAKNTAKHLNGGKKKHIGYFNSREEAGLARDLYVIENYLDSHRLNFPTCRLRPLNF